MTNKKTFYVMVQVEVDVMTDDTDGSVRVVRTAMPTMEKTDEFTKNDSQVYLHTIRELKAWQKRGGRPVPTT